MYWAGQEVHLGFPIRWYRMTRVSFLANPLLVNNVDQTNKKKISRNQKGEYSEELLKLVGNLGTDFRNCGHGPQEQAKEKEREKVGKINTPHSLLVTRKGRDPKESDPAVCSGPT